MTGGTDEASRPLAGLAALLRFTVRRDRMRAPVWVASLVGIVVVSAFSVTSLYETPDELAGYAAVASADAAVKAITGPGYGLDTPTQGAVVMNETEMMALVGIALMAMFMVIRHTRAEEETGRAELVRAAPVGRHTALVVTCIWVSCIAVIVGVGLTAGMLAAGLPTAGSIAFGAATASTGLVFVGVSAVAAQLAAGARSARAVAGAVLGASFMLRAVGDMGNGALTWASPLGWAQAIRAFADERWWVLALLLPLAGILVTASIALSARRDLGAGILHQQPGPARGDPGLATPLALAVRLQRTSVIGWSIGVGLTGFFMGIVGDQADALAENDAVADVFALSGQGSVTEAFLATSMLMTGLIASGFAVSAVLRLHSEELEGRVEPMLAAPVSRHRWLSSHLTIALVGSVVVMVVCGVLTGVGYAVSTGDFGEILPLIGAGLVIAPALFVASGIALALVGALPRAASAAWVTVALSTVVALLGETLSLPQWVRDLSPFQHTPALPAASFDIVPVVLLVLVAAGLIVVGTVGFRRRDVG